MRKELRERVAKALEQDNTLVVDRKDAHKCPGFTTQYMEYLGIKKSDLKRLERAGLALRGYTKNVWLAGEKMPDGRIVEDNPFVSYHGRGHHPMWILIADKEETDASVSDSPK
jgi:hypothetical protein